MVIVDYTLNLANDYALNAFDDVKYVAFGDDDTTPTQTDTTLGNELLRVKAVNVSKDTSTNIYTFTGIVPITQLNSSTIYEIGLFTSSSSGTMCIRFVISHGLTKVNSEEVVVKINIKSNTVNT